MTLLLATVVPVAALAQQEPAESVPMELARALIPDFMGEGPPPEILVGRVPEALEALVELPAGVRVVGAAVSRRSTQTVLAIARPAQPVLDELVARLREAGWTEGPRFREYGFVSSVAVEPTALCSEAGEFLHVIATPGGGEEELATIRHMRDQRMTPCQAAAQRSPSLHVPMPALTPPEGVRVTGANAGGGMDGMYARGLLTVELGVEELSAHYGGQLREHGWRSDVRVAEQGLVVETWRLEDDEGVAWSGMLIVSTMESGCREAFLRINRVSEP